ncbi:hypothetical protein HNP49_003424 [Pseudomonas fluvialis]|uniref:Uncharacterized protein n=1 Tax=Pseudomonas fluvialis TaxID=1793966 RepID=A0A7X0BXC2_9PSED|nr:hypothetical protein [Pseudomonas fluvialis]MBB6343226.1 hypothetical protein [Pseudomonas fluvialis]
MRIYVASNDFSDTADQLVKQLARINLQTTKATPVAVVDERYELSQALVKDADIPNTAFHLDDFLHEKGSVADGVMLVDANQIATKLSSLDTEWVLFEFGQNDQQTCIDFVRKLARYNYMTPTLRDTCVIFSVPSMYLGYFARTLNESFNNLAVGDLAVAKSGQVGMLMLSTKVERVFVGLPLLTAPLIRLNRLLMFVYDRFVKSA